MAVLTPTTMQGAGQRTVSQNTLTASDTFTFTFNPRQVLILWNTTGGTITPTITGDTVQNFNIVGVGVNALVASGSSIAIPAGQVVTMALDQNYRWFSDGVTITAGTGLTAALLTE